MQTLRYLLAVSLLTLLRSGTVIVAALLGVRQRTGGVYDQAQRRWGAGMLRWTGVTVRVEGAERLDPSVETVYIANHASFVDIWAILKELPGTVRFVFKKEMNRIPVMGLAMRRMKHIPIDRKNLAAAFSAYEEAAVLMRTGISAVVFAEGTRSRDGRLHTFKKGPFVLAIAAGARVLPILCAGTFETLPKGSFTPKRGTVTLRIGEPIPTTGMTYEDRDRLSRAARAQLIALGGDPVETPA
ncbi:MAG: lysophospholipid acyltransferase family protein [Gemmatimonadales bacterium]